MLRKYKKDPKKTPVIYTVDSAKKTLDTNENHIIKALNVIESTGSGSVTFLQINNGIQLFTDVSEAVFQMEKNNIDTIVTLNKVEIEKYLPKTN